MGYFVFNGAKLECTMGDKESFLEIIDPAGAGFICGQKAANIKDCKPLINIPPFGMCSSLLNPSVAAATELNYGILQKMPCVVPNIMRDKWENKEESKMYIRGEPVLMNADTIDCVFQGTIEITEKIREGVDTGTLGIDKDVINDPDWNADRGPGTQYINDKGQLLYRRNDGASGRTLIVQDKYIPILNQLLRKAKMVGSLNDPNINELLIIGMTGGQYTNWRCTWGGNYPYQFKDGYNTGYHGTNTEKKGEEIVGVGVISFHRGQHGAVNMTGSVEAKLDGIRFGESDKKNGLIDALNPTSRITGGPLLQI
jgi:hypothetical protein